MELKELNRQDLPVTELCNIGKKYKTDKPSYGYTKVYYEIMKDVKDSPINFFEIGIYFGASLRMWHEFFPKGTICGIDNGRLLPNSGILVGGMDGTKIDILSSDDVKLLHPNAKVNYEPGFGWIEQDRLKCSVADQRSEKQLKESFNHFGCNTFDFILDDGQHWQEHQQQSLGIMFPNIKPGGYYIIEDIATQYDLQNGVMWGQRKKDASDSTDAIFKYFLETGALISRYLSDEETNYIEKNIDDIFLFDAKNNNNSPISGHSKLLIIKKK